FGFFLPSDWTWRTFPPCPGRDSEVGLSTARRTELVTMESPDEEATPLRAHLPCRLSTPGRLVRRVRSPRCRDRAKRGTSTDRRCGRTGEGLEPRPGGHRRRPGSRPAPAVGGNRAVAGTGPEDGRGSVEPRCRRAARP